MNVGLLFVGCVDKDSHLVVDSGIHGKRGSAAEFWNCLQI